MPATAYSYQRFSSPSQSEGDSVRRQTSLRDAWLAKSGAVLDTSLRMTDEGVSGFTGSHRDNPDRHALAAFLEMVRKGKVPRGSFLIVESLDRLTREHVRPALTLLLNLIDAGIRVVQLLPVEAVYDDNTDAMNLMLAIMELSRGHSESRMKSERLSRAWEQKKLLAASAGKPLTKALPSWVRCVNGKLELIPDRAATVRRIFALATTGHGLGVITKTLNAERVPVIARGEYWARSYVGKILGNRATVGEYQPMKGHVGPNRKPDGKPIPDFFPLVIDEDTWHAAQAALASRKGKGGRIGETVALFSGLLVDMRDSGPIHSVNKGAKSGGTNLVSYRAAMGVKGAAYISFPRAVFERALLSQLAELNPADVLPDGNEAANRVAVLKGREAAVESRIEKLKTQMVASDEIAPLVAVLRTLEADRLKVVEELSVAQREAASPAATALSDCKSLTDLLDAGDDPNEVRTRLRGAIRRAVESVRCLFLTHGHDRLAFATVVFQGGGQRVYVLLYTPPKGNAAKHTPGRWWCHSHPSAGFRIGNDSPARTITGTDLFGKPFVDHIPARKGNILSPGFKPSDVFANRFRELAQGEGCTNGTVA